MLLKTLFLNLLLTVAASFLHAQIYKDTTPLHKFFRVNFDSTIIYHKWSSWHPFPNYYIIAKKDSSVYFFTYKSLYSKAQGRYYPADLNIKFAQEEQKFNSTIPDTSNYFVPVFIDNANRNLFWSQINSFDVWNITEVKENKSGCEVDDDGSDSYYLITKQGVKVTTFYAADFYERCNPGNVNLINQIKTRNAILQIFRD